MPRPGDGVPSTPPSGPSAGLGRQAASSAVWMTAQKWVVRILGLASTAVLTRLLAPQQFGVVAAAATVIPLIYLLADLGFSTYLVQADDPDQRTMSSGFWFSIVAGVILATVAVAGAPLLAALFATPAATDVIRVLSTSVLFVAVASVPDALLRRKLAFRRLAVQDTVSAIVGQVAAVVLAFSGAGAWALVAQTLVGQALGAGLRWSVTDWRPTRTFSWRTFSQMARFGSKVLSTEFVALGRAWGEAAIVAHALGAGALGLLTIAQRLAQAAQDLSSVALIPVSTVVFAKVRDAPDRLRAAYQRSLAAGYTAAAPPLVFVAVGAPLIIPLLFGPAWAPSTTVAQALAVAGILTLGANIDNGLFFGVGRPGTWLAYAVGVDALTVASTAVAVRWGLSGIAVAFIGVALVATVARWLLTASRLGMPVSTAARPFWNVLVCGGLSGLAGVGVHHATHGLPALVSLACIGVVVLVVHLGASRVTAPHVLRGVLELLPLPERGRSLAGRLLRLAPTAAPFAEPAPARGT